MVLALKISWHAPICDPPLMDCGFTVGVDQDQFFVSHHFEEKSGSVIDGLVCEACEYLFEGRLLDAILFDIHLRFVLLDQTEKESDRLVFFRHSKFVEVADLFQEFNLAEDSCDVFNELEAVDLNVEELDQGSHANHAIAVRGLLVQV